MAGRPVTPEQTRVDAGALAAAILAGERTALARGITLVESRSDEHAGPAAELIDGLLPKSGGSIRIGVTGSPGIGKSTLIDTFGTNLTAAGHRVAVLAVDPSSSVSGGSILGDKTRMARLAADENAFIRPSPAGLEPGGVAARTREALLLCEAAGFDVVIVETVGTGQSEAAVADMVDIVVALMPSGAGDELQGLKKGVIERADVIAITKADGAGRTAAETARAQVQVALRILAEGGRASPRVLLVSGQENVGLDELWQTIRDLHDKRKDSGALEKLRAEQAAIWFHALVDERIRARLFSAQAVRERRGELEAVVRAGRMTPAAAAQALIAKMEL